MRQAASGRGDAWSAAARPHCLPRELSPEAVQRSRRSIIAASAAHPAFVRVLDSGETSDGRSFMVMELAEGRGLHEILAENEPLKIFMALSDAPISARTLAR